MLPIQLYPAEFITMIGFLGKVTSPQLDVPVRHQPVSIAVLIAYQTRLKIDRVYAWRYRNKQRSYRYNMPAHVVLALYKEMLTQPLDPTQQAVLSRLDQALVDYRVPMSERVALKSNTLYDAIA